MASAALVAGMAVVTLVPVLVFAYLTRNNERNRPEPYKAIFGALLWGGALAYILYRAFETQAEQAFGAVHTTITGYGPVYLALVLGLPLIHELGKGVGLGLMRRNMDEVEDGIIYGAAIGLGFAGIENLLFGVWATNTGFDATARQMAAQMLANVCMHTAASAFLGFGYSLAIRRTTGRLQAMVPYFLFAVLMHAMYLALIVRLAWYGYAAALLMAAGVAGLVQVKVRQLDAKGAKAPAPAKA